MAADTNNSSPQTTGHEARTLTEEEVERLKKDTTLVSEFKQNKLEKEAEKNWDLFYKRNTTKFFKDRHWPTREFEELIVGEKSDGQRVILEVGCGVGNFMFPLLEEDKNHGLFFYACDFSKRAVQFVKEHPSYDSSRCKAFHADVTSGLTGTVPPDSVDIATMIFVLSAIHPDKMVQALASVLEVLKPGGLLLFRDYGLFDYAMLRFAPGHKLAENLYVRQDGTRAYYFSLEVLQELAEKAGFTVISNQYVQRETVNKKEGLCVPRIFVQARLAKPCSDSSVHSQADCSRTVSAASSDKQSSVCGSGVSSHSRTDAVSTEGREIPSGASSELPVTDYSSSSGCVSLGTKTDCLDLSAGMSSLGLRTDNKNLSTREKDMETIDVAELTTI